MPGEGPHAGSSPEYLPSSEERTISLNVTEKLSHQDEDTRTQHELTGKVGVRLTRPEKSTSSRWAALKRLLRIGA
jgi:hypothetical protein